MLPDLAAVDARVDATPVTRFDVLADQVAVGLRAALPHAPVGLLITWYFVSFARLSVEIHEGYGTSAFDIGLYDQGLWLLSRFDAPFVTIMGRNLFGDHTSFILVALVPLYWIAPGVQTLLVVQAFAMALGAVPVYLLALKRLRNVAFATVLAGAFLLHPALGWTNLENYHPDSFLVPLMALAIYAAVEWKPKTFLVASALALLVKEDAVLIVLPLAVWVAFRRDRARGVILAVASLAWAAFATNVVMRSLIGVPTLNTWRIPFGGVGGFIEAIFRRPGAVADYVGSEDRPWYVWQMLAPTGLVFLVRPEIAATAVLVLSSNVVSTFVYQHLIQYHYSMAVLPALSLGTVYAISKLRYPEWRGFAVAIVGAAAVATAYLWGPYSFSRNDYPHWDPSLPVVQQIDQAKEAIPDGAVVSAYHSFVPHVGHRERIYMWPTPFRAAYWNTFEQEGQRLEFADEIEYLFLPTELTGDTQQVFAQIEDEFEVAKRVGYATVYRRAG